MFATFTSSIRGFLVFSLILICLGMPSLSKAQSNPPAWSATTHYAVGDLVSAYGNSYRCIHSVQSTGLDPSRAYGFWELNFARVNTTLLIGMKQPFPSLVAAWDYVLNARIADSAMVTLKIVTTAGPFSETFNQAFSLDHAFGSRITITADALQNNALTFSNGSDGLTIDSSHSIAALTNLSIYGVAGITNVVGVKASSNSSIQGLGFCWIQNFDTSIESASNASVTSFGCYIENYSNAACVATSGGTLTFPSGVNLSGTSTGTTSTIGLDATVGGHIVARQSTIKNLPFGAMANTGGVVDLESSNVTNCYVGCYAQNRGYIDCGLSTINGNSDWDVQAQYGGTMNAIGCTFNLINVGTNDGSNIYH